MTGECDVRDQHPWDFQYKNDRDDRWKFLNKKKKAPEPPFVVVAPIHFKLLRDTNSKQHTLEFLLCIVPIH